MFEAKGSANVSDDVYEAVLLGIEIKEAGENSLSDKPYARWTFGITDDDGEDAELIGNSSLTFGQKSKARKWWTAILRRVIENGETINPPDLCPVDCRIVVKNDPESGFARIEDVLGEKKTPKEAKTNNTKAKPVSSNDDGIDI